MSQVLQCTQFEALICSCSAAGLGVVGHHLVHARRAEVLARVAVLLAALASAHTLGVGHHQVRGLVLVVHRARQVHVGELVERRACRRTSSASRLADSGSARRAASACARGRACPRTRSPHAQVAAARQHLRRRVRAMPAHSPRVEALVEVAHAAQLGGGPRVPRSAARSSPSCARREVAGEQALEQRLGGEHARLDREVDALEPRAVQEAAACRRRAAGRRPTASASRSSRPRGSPWRRSATGLPPSSSARTDGCVLKRCRLPCGSMRRVARSRGR